MSMFTLAISCLITSNLPLFMDLTFQVPMRYCSLQHRTDFHHQTHSQVDAFSTLAQPLHSWSYFSTLLQYHIALLFSSIILGTYWPGKLFFQFPIFLPFHIIHGFLKTRILKWFAIPFSTGLCFVRTLHHHPSILNGPTWHGSEFHWVRQDCSPCDQIG